MKRSTWFVSGLALLSLLAVAEGLLVVTPAMLDRVERDYRRPARERVEAWAELLESGVEGSELDVVRSVNRFFNSTRFVSDVEHWGQEDYWATPVEFLASNGGDCEDFSIAKYFTLRHLGVPEERLRMVYVKAVKLNQAHMVVAYLPTPDADPLVLDNLVPEVRPASQRRDLVPVYSFNGEGLWLAKERGLGRSPVGGSERLSMWTELQARLQNGDLRRARS